MGFACKIAETVPFMNEGVILKKEIPSNELKPGLVNS